jgi:hypothetical protein
MLPKRNGWFPNTFKAWEKACPWWGHITFSNYTCQFLIYLIKIVRILHQITFKYLKYLSCHESSEIKVTKNVLFGFSLFLTDLKFDWLKRNFYFTRFMTWQVFQILKCYLMGILLGMPFCRQARRFYVFLIICFLVLRVSVAFLFQWTQCYEYSSSETPTNMLTRHVTQTKWMISYT